MADQDPITIPTAAMPDEDDEQEEEHEVLSNQDQQRQVEGPSANDAADDTDAGSNKEPEHQEQENAPSAGDDDSEGDTKEAAPKEDDQVQQEPAPESTPQPESEQQQQQQQPLKPRPPSSARQQGGGGNSGSRPSSQALRRKHMSKAKSDSPSGDSDSNAVSESATRVQPEDQSEGDDAVPAGTKENGGDENTGAGEEGAQDQGEEAITAQHEQQQDDSAGGAKEAAEKVEKAGGEVQTEQYAGNAEQSKADAGAADSTPAKSESDAKAKDADDAEAQQDNKRAQQDKTVEGEGEVGHTATGADAKEEQGTAGKGGDDLTSESTGGGEGDQEEGTESSKDDATHEASAAATEDTTDTQQRQQQQQEDNRGEGKDKESEGQQRQEGAKQQEEDKGDNKDKNKNKNKKQKTKKQKGKDDDEEEEEMPKMDPNFFYEWDGQSTPDAAGDLTQQALTLHHSFGYDMHKHDNLHALDKEVVAFVSGAYVVLLNIRSGEQQYIRSSTNSAVSAISVDPSRTFLAVADKGDNPPITIFSYPDLKRYRVLKGGALRGFAHLCFDGTGQKLASVATAPDYRLTVWDWREEAIILRTKAFSSDVWRVTFSAYNDGQLTTSGQGHIRFWKMATTFTGLKLQGQIGKFGRTELSDIAGYVEFPDGKVLSGCEWGNLLLWEGGFIKCEIARADGKTCHQGAVEAVTILDETGDVATAGADGHVRVWDFEMLDSADRPHDSPYFTMDPLYERKLASDAHVRCLSKSLELGEEDAESVYYAQDVSGRLWRMDLSPSPTTRPPAPLARFHSGGITNLAASPTYALAVSAGDDGQLRVYDYEKRKVACSWMSSELQDLSCRCVVWANTAADPEARTLLAGFSDGVVRQLRLVDASRLVLTQVAKPFKGSVDFAALTPDGRRLCVVSNDPKSVEALLASREHAAESKDASNQQQKEQKKRKDGSSAEAGAAAGGKQGDATGADDRVNASTPAYASACFFLELDTLQLRPIGFMLLEHRVNRVRCGADSQTLLLACDGARAVELRVAGHADRKSAHTYELSSPEQRTYTFNSIMHILEPEPEPEMSEDEAENEEGGSAGDGEGKRDGTADSWTAHGEEQDGKGGKKKGKKEPKPVPKFLPTEAPVLDAWYGGDGSSSSGMLMLSVGGKEAGYVYECSWEMPEKPLMAHDVRGLSPEEKKAMELQQEQHKKRAGKRKRKVSLSKQSSRQQLDLGQAAGGSQKLSFSRQTSVVRAGGGAGGAGDTNVSGSGSGGAAAAAAGGAKGGAGADGAGSKVGGAEQRAAATQCVPLTSGDGMLLAGTDGRVRLFDSSYSSHWVLGMHDTAVHHSHAHKAGSGGGGRSGGGGGDGHQEQQDGRNGAGGAARVQVAVSCDGQFVLSAGADGSVFVFKLNELQGKRTKLPAGTAAEDLPKRDVGSQATDVLDPESYSIEEELQKAERDEFLSAAQQKKQNMERSVAQLRREFERLLAHNASLPASQRLPAEAFVMNLSLRKDMEERKQTAVLQLEREMAWQLEKARIAHHKLRKHFMDDVVQPRIAVHCLQRPEHVAGFRCAQLSDAFQRSNSAVVRSVSKMKTLASRARKKVTRRQEREAFHEEVLRSRLRREAEEQRRGLREDDEASQAGRSGLLSATARRLATGRGRKEAERQKAEQRRERRAEMRARMEELIKTKPDPNKIDPSDEAKIKHLRQNMGDYKLKTSSDYFVPVQERVNTAKKREQIIALRQRIYDAKTIFNSHIQTLRTKKVQSIEQIKVCRDLLRVLHAQLGRPEGDLPEVPALRADEVPERRDEVTPERLAKFRREYEQQLLQEREEAAKARSGGFGGFGGFGGGDKGSKKGADGSHDAGGGGPAEGGLASEGASDETEELSARPSLSDVARPRRRSTIFLPQAERQTWDASLTQTGGDASRLRRELLMECTRLENRIKEITKKFDEMVVQLVRTKRDTEVRIKFAEYMHVLCYQELVQLKVFDIREQELEKVKEKKEADLEACQEANDKASGSYSERQKQLATLQAQEKEVQADFSSLLGDGHPFAKFLTRMFKRKVKRRRRKSLVGKDGPGGQGKEEGGEVEEDDDEEYLSSDESSDDDFSDDDSDMEDFDDSVCPQGCDPAAYNKVAQLREWRLDVEEELAEVKRQADVSKKESDSTAKRLKSLETAVERAEGDIAVFQVEKQHKLNELHVAVPLRTSQIFFMEDNWLPTDFSQALVFAQQGLDKLKATIAGLQDEKTRQRQVFKEIRAAQARLHRELREKESVNKVHKRKCEEMQHLKFGRVVDLEELDAGSGGNRQAEQLKETQAELEYEQEKETRELDMEISRLRSELSQLTRQNTAVLADLTDLRRDRSELEHQLDDGKKLLHSSAEEAVTKTREEVKRLRALSRMQQEQISHMHTELQQLVRKDGHVAPPPKSSGVTSLPPL